MKRSVGWIGLVLGASLMMAGCAETTLAVDTAKAINNQPDGPRAYKIGSPYQFAASGTFRTRTMSMTRSGSRPGTVPSFMEKQRPTANGLIRTP